MLHTFARSHPDAMTAAEYISAFAASAEALAREMPVDIMAHPTLVAFPFRGIPPEELWTESAEQRLVDALAGNDIAFELSNRYLPHSRIVRRAIDAGVRISLGSDGHTREQVADIRAPLALARALGVDDESLYDPRRHGSRTMSAHHA
jgi:histidinol phosphatase-like PHP family hydrolase